MNNTLPKLKKNNENVCIKNFKKPKYDVFDKKIAEEQFNEFLKQGEKKNAVSKR